MSASSYDNRTAVVQEIIDRLRAHDDLVGVQIEHGWPGDTIKPEAIWVDGIDGDLQIESMQAGPKEYSDSFRLPFEVRVANRSTGDVTATRMSEVAGAIRQTIAADPTLGDFPNLDWALVDSQQQTCAETRDGWLGFVEVVVVCHSTFNTGAA